MGRPSEETLTHFSHPHPLILITTDHHEQPAQTLNSSSSSCAGCNLEICGGTFYSCTACNFFLHKQCFDMPKRITHPFHKEHVLTLHAKPASAGIFNCYACFEEGKGFSYSCDTCGVDLHILCAIVPLSITNNCHPHKLDLTFGSPYETKNFSCDICRNLGGDHWLYRCGSCGFDAHLNCARRQHNYHMAGTSAIRSVPMPQPLQQNFPHPQYHNYHHQYAVPYGYPNNGMREAMYPGGYGGGGVYNGLQQLRRTVSGLNNYGGILGGVAGDIWQQMQMNGGGEGGMDMMQSLMGGNRPDFVGGGGFDFLGGFL